MGRQFEILLILIALSFAFNEKASGIWGGSEVQSNNLLSKSAVRIYLGGERDPTCSGTIIAANAILTAAHCFRDYKENDVELHIGFGVNETDSEILIPRKKASHWIRHPDYKPEVDSVYVINIKDASDLALVFFTGGLPIGYLAAEIVSPTYTILGLSQNIQFAGYGPCWLDKKRPWKFETLCSARSHFSRFSETEIVLGDSTHYPQHGDSGGPAYLFTKDRMQLVGVASRGVSHGRNALAKTVYTRADEYKLWIEDAIKNFSLSH